jgi:hypothetical protein
LTEVELLHLYQSRPVRSPDCGGITTEAEKRLYRSSCFVAVLIWRWEPPDILECFEYEAQSFPYSSNTIQIASRDHYRHRISG